MNKKEQKDSIRIDKIGFSKNSPNNCSKSDIAI